MDLRITAASAAAVLGLTTLAGCGRVADAGDAHPATTPVSSTTMPVATDPTTGPGTSPTSSPTHDDGTAGAGPWSPALLPEASDLVEYGASRTPWSAGPTSDRVPKAWLRPCRGDAGDPPVRAGYLAAASRDYTDPDGTAGAEARAQAVLLDYPTRADADAAYQDLATTYQGCSGVLRADGAEHVSPTTASEVDLGAFSSGPNAAEARSFMVTYDAPPDEHAVTQLQHGIAVDGSHLLVVTLTQDTQDHWPDLADSMPAIVEHFGRTRGLPRTLLYDSQLDYVRVGATYAQAMSGGDVAPSGKSPTGASVCLSRRYGVETVWMPPQVTTVEGIGIGSTEAEVRHAYPDATTDGDGYLNHRLWGGTDATELHVGLRGGRVFEWAVTRVHQHCFD